MENGREMRGEEGRKGQETIAGQQTNLRQHLVHVTSTLAQNTGVCKTYPATP